MRIEPIPGDCLRIWLAEEECEEWGLGSEPTDRRRFRRRLRSALATVGHRWPERLMAEVVPVEGGCLLLVTPQLWPDDNQPAVYGVPDEDNLLALMEQWQRGAEESQPTVSLYGVAEGYHLVVYPDGTLSQRQRHLLLEYATLEGCGEGAAAHSAEYGRGIATGIRLTDRGRRPPEPWDPER